MLFWACYRVAHASRIPKSLVCVPSANGGSEFVSSRAAAPCSIVSRLASHATSIHLLYGFAGRGWIWACPLRCNQKNRFPVCSVRLHRRDLEGTRLVPHNSARHTNTGLDWTLRSAYSREAF